MSLSAFTAEALLRVANIVEAVPDKKFNLDYWYSPKSENGCGTTFCAMGHAACDPWFRARGLRLDKSWQEILFTGRHGEQLDSFEAVASFLHIDEEDAWYLFYSNSYDEVPTRERVVARIRNFVATDGEQYELPTPEQTAQLQEMMAMLEDRVETGAGAGNGNEQMRRILAQTGTGLVIPTAPETSGS